MDRKQCCVKLSVQPSRGLVDEKFVVLVQNAFPGFQLTIHTHHQCEDGHSWEAFGHYTADATGTVNVSEDPSLGGTYSETEPMGLLWSLRPVPGSKPGLLRCAVCINGTHVQPIDGFLEELIGYFKKNADKIRFSKEEEVIFRDLPLPIPTDRSLKVDVGQLQCPLLLIVGEDDQNWPSYESAQDMKEMMERAGNSHLLTVLSYPNTGHLIEPPYMPHSRASTFHPVRSASPSMALWGGQTVEHSHAQEDSWKKMLAFLRENLYGGADPGARSISHL
ncbi:acyl-coenzyme A thioesterase 1-like [Parambassis ranga]|uniref:Acyl-coenzyme A thioesterase 1-like n=1 Tax=Parambassis ranga TaxID=210632 RepID=A0A6P7HXN3_9TELE|nr:acyl-coenzyme A thioesterase 1-like [Parambassis ranga]